jgi:hypothetical protein
MPAITSDNKNYFKSYLKRHREKFTNPLQQINLTDLQNVFNSTNTGFTIGTQTVKVGLFGGKLGDDVLDISSLTGGELLYIPGQYQDYIKLKTDSSDRYQTIYFYTESLNYARIIDPASTSGYNTLYLGETTNLGNKRITVEAVGGLLLSVENGPAYTISHDASADDILDDQYYIDEGDSITFTINVSNNDGEYTYWTIGGTTSDSDFNDTQGYFYGNGTKTVTLNSLLDSANSENEYFYLQLRQDNYTGPVVDESGYISLRDKIITCSITPSITTIDEGGQVTFTINTTGIDDGTTLYYEPVFTTGQANSSDITSQFGSVTINSGTSSFNITASQDVYEESSETFKYLVYKDIDDNNNPISLSTSSDISITNTTSYNFSVSSSSIVEGNNVTYTVNTTGIPNGTGLRWYITTMNMTDFTYRNGIFYINNNTGSFTITPKQDFDVESDEILTVELRASSSSSSVLSTVNTIPNVTVTDAPYTVTVTPSSPLTIVESAHDSTSQVVLTLTTTGAPDGSQLTVHERTNTGDITFDNSTITINNNSATVTATIVRDGRTEGSEDHIIDFKNQSSQVLASSPTITITDTSFVGSRTDGKTFGPIDVNRDNGQEANISEWYDLCDIDSIADGSKISLFIDNSGSLTTPNVQASYNKFLQKLSERNITIVVVENSNEDWITPFDTELI